MLISGPALRGQILLVTGGWAITDVNSKWFANILYRPSDQHSYYPHTPEIPDKVAFSGSNHEPRVYLWQSLGSDMSLVVKVEHLRSIFVSYELHFSLAGCLLKMQSVTARPIPSSIPVSSSLYPDVVYWNSLLQNLTLTSHFWSPLAINNRRSWWPLREWQSIGHLFRLELD